jgi:hypothetical protein
MINNQRKQYSERRLKLTYSIGLVAECLGPQTLEDQHHHHRCHHQDRVQCVMSYQIELKMDSNQDNQNSDVMLFP